MLNLRQRRAFTLVEVVVSVLLVAALAAVTIPTIRARMEDGYEDALAGEFSTLQSALIAYRQDVGKYPPTLDYLTALPATPKDFCGTNLSAQAIANWRGPYVSRIIPANFTSYGVNQNDAVVYRIGPLSGIIGDANSTFIYVEIDGAYDDAVANLDFRFDGTPPTSFPLGGTIGSFQYSASGSIYVMKLLSPKKAGTC